VETVLALFYLGWIALALALGGAACAALGALLIRHRLPSGSREGPGPRPAVTVLKPLHGWHPGLEEMLESALNQDYGGPVQLVCGIQNSGDPARVAVENLQRRYQDRDISLVIDPRLHGANRKVSNLMNMMAAARHNLLVVSDADIAVPRHWLATIARSLAADRVGAATCFYTGEGRNIWSRLSAMGISYHFLPNAVFGTTTRFTQPFFGATMALRREILEEIGGFSALRNCLADDYEIGRRVRASGYSIAYPPILVRHDCIDASWTDLWRHEFRWARTVRSVNAAGHLGSVTSHALPLALLGAVALGFSPVAVMALGTVTLARLFLKLGIDDIAGVSAGPLWLLPFRDLLSFAVFWASLAGMDVSWRGDRLRVGKDGAISQVGG
jgi:ceramide glucosyltransferase